MGFLQLAFNEAAGEAGGIDRRRSIPLKKRQRADVIFVTMGNQNGFDLILVFD